MVSSAHPLATEAGLEILASGGNAFDAAVAVAAALGVVEPMMSGIGGYGATVVYDARAGETRFLEVGSRTPASLDPSVFRPPTPDYEANRCGAPTVATPGSVQAWETMWREYGDLEWEQLLEPAVRYAEEGFVVDETLGAWISSEYPDFPANARQIYGTNGVPLATGDRLVQRDLANSLRRISSQGSGAVYGGELGEAMVSAVQENGGFLTMDDLRDNRARWRPTINLDYEGNEVVTASPPATSWNALLRLGAMEKLDPAALGHNTASYLHAFTEVSKQAWPAARAYAADPDIEPTPIDLLLSEDFTSNIADQVDPSSAAPYDPPTTYDSATSCSPTGYRPPALAGASTGTPVAAQEHTTHFVVADGEGNVVSATQTLGNVFGSKVMPEGTGVWLNDALAWSRFEPAGNVFDVYPGRQSLYALCPTLVLRDGKPWAALGTPGGRTIVQTTPQMLMNLTDFGMDIQQAISAPRMSFVVPGLLAVENGIPQDVRGQLSALGHEVIPAATPLGNATGLSIEYGPDGKPSRFTGAADPRGEGVAAGL